MDKIKDDIRSEFESKKYTDDEMISSLEELINWCNYQIKDIKEYK